MSFAAPLDELNQVMSTRTVFNDMSIKLGASNRLESLFDILKYNVPDADQSELAYHLEMKALEYIEKRPVLASAFNTHADKILQAPWREVGTMLTYKTDDVVFISATGEKRQIPMYQYDKYASHGVAMESDGRVTRYKCPIVDGIPTGTGTIEYECRKPEATISYTGEIKQWKANGMGKATFKTDFSTIVLQGSWVDGRLFGEECTVQFGKDRTQQWQYIGQVLAPGVPITGTLTRYGSVHTGTFTAKLDAQYGVFAIHTWFASTGPGQLTIKPDGRTFTGNWNDDGGLVHGPFTITHHGLTIRGTMDDSGQITGSYQVIAADDGTVLQEYDATTTGPRDDLIRFRGREYYIARTHPFCYSISESRFTEHANLLDTEAETLLAHAGFGIIATGTHGSVWSDV